MFRTIRTPRRYTTRPMVEANDDLRVAAMDVGSNSIHMIVSQVDPNGGLSTLWRVKEMVGLGRLSFPSHRLTKVAMDRAVITINRFLAEARRFGCERVLAVATSAVREAHNGGEFIERVRRELGVHLRVVSARDEARLIYLGVRQALDLSKGPNLIIDVGGGSVELIVADKEKALLLESRKLGAARMTARFIKADPPDAKEVKSLLSYYDRELASVLESVRALKPVRVIATSGANENLAAMAAALAADEKVDEPGGFTKQGITAVTEKLLASTSDQRAGFAGLDDKRRDQILSAALLMREIVDKLDIPRVELCRSALREGIVADYLSRHRPELETRREVPNPRRRAVMDLGRRSHWQYEHAQQVAKITLQLFDSLRPLHGLTRKQRELIEYGALLHDIGAVIGRTKHHKHSAYLIRNGELKPFSKKEIDIIASIARFHRKSPPSEANQTYAELPKKARRVVDVGTALLRIADGLDRTNCSVVDEVHTRTRVDRVEIIVTSKTDAELEIWSAQSRGELFSMVFGRAIAIVG